MTGLLQNLARLGRGEPIAGAARGALPPRFAAPVQTDNAPMLETWPDERQPSAPPQTAIRDLTTNHRRPEAQAPQHIEVGSDDTGAPLRTAAKPATATQPVQSNTALPSPSAKTALPIAPRDPPPMTHPHDVVVRDTPRLRNETATPPAPPLGQTVLASQAQRRRETPPVIKVTIDRIDIRSPEPTRATRAVKPAPKPSVSLSDYLRRPGPGGRA